MKVPGRQRVKKIDEIPSRYTKNWGKSDLTGTIKKKWTFPEIPGSHGKINWKSWGLTSNKSDILNIREIFSEKKANYFFKDNGTSSQDNLNLFEPFLGSEIARQVSPKVLINLSICLRNVNTNVLITVKQYVRFCDKTIIFLRVLIEIEKARNPLCILGTYLKPRKVLGCRSNLYVKNNNILLSIISTIFLLSS